MMEKLFDSWTGSFRTPLVRLFDHYKRQAAYICLAICYIF